MKSAGDENLSLPKDPTHAVELLMEKYGTTILRTAYYYLHDQHLAEDISQEVFVRTYQNWSKFKRESHVKTWLIRITINLCKDHLGVKSKNEEPVAELLIHRPSDTNVEQDVINKIRNSEILKYVMNLPLPYREVIYLYYYLSLSTVEIAEVTQIAEGTVRSRLYRARTELGIVLKRRYGINES